MEQVYTCCAGLDVHKRTVVACLLDPEGGAGDKEVRTFGTTMVALEELRDWLVAAGCTHVAMEATGVYWKPIHHVLEGQCALLKADRTYLRGQYR
jgi:transposase